VTVPHVGVNPYKLPRSEDQLPSAMLHLFRIVFHSVTLFQDNEQVVRPYIKKVVGNAIEFSVKAMKPRYYFTLLRALFRSIGGGKFELLYKEFLPLLPDLLQRLMYLPFRGPSDLREICIELCLTVPARLSSLLGFIPVLMHAVLLALKARDDNVVKLGLRTLEFWVDNLNPDYLYPHMKPSLNTLMRNLCLLLKPSPSQGRTALTVMGKLGGRNRRFMIEECDLAYRDQAMSGLALNAAFLSSSTVVELDKNQNHISRAIVTPSFAFALPMDALIEVACKLIADRTPTRHYAKHQVSVDCV
jgi:transformation/transcription domain-associated protein